MRDGTPCAYIRKEKKKMEEKKKETEDYADVKYIKIMSDQNREAAEQRVTPRIDQNLMPS